MFAAIPHDEERRRGRPALALWLAGVGSIALHGLLLWSTAGGPELAAENATRATMALVDFAVPGSGPPGAPLGETLAAAPGASDEAVRDEPAARPRQLPSSRPRAALTAEGAADVAAVSEAEVLDEGVPGALGEAPDPTSDAFLDGLLTRSAARGVPGARAGSGCPDPIAGTWRARRYDTTRGRWGVFTLYIERPGSGAGRPSAALRGRIRLHAWTGPRSGRTPPRCGPGVYEHSVRMPATGAFDGERFHFEASSFERVTHCMDARFDYNLDRFTGRVEGDVLAVVNNDGGHEVDAPYRFRRLSCE